MKNILISQIPHALAAVGGYITLTFAQVILPNWEDFLIYIALVFGLELVFMPLFKFASKRLKAWVIKKFDGEVEKDLLDIIENAEKEVEKKIDELVDKKEE